MGQLLCSTSSAWELFRGTDTVDANDRRSSSSNPWVEVHSGCLDVDNPALKITRVPTAPPPTGGGGAPITREVRTR